MTKQQLNLWICSVQGIGIRKLRELEKEFKTPENIYFASEKSLCRVKGIGEKEARKIMESKEQFQGDEFLNKLKLLQMKCITWFDEEYPMECRHIYEPPKCLFFRGELPGQGVRIAIVGARNCSVYGKEMARKFSFDLARAGVAVVSGMARGIDGWAHQGALEANGKTYAILGNSAEICYPAEHERLYQSIMKQGGVLSEYPPGTKADPRFFPMRNRIIGALSRGVLVVEAKKKSGSLITAEQALEQGKDVFVVPGRIGDSLSEGCNNLIKQGAYLVTSPEEILEFYGIFTHNKKENFTKINIFLERKEKMVYASLSLEPKHVSMLAKELNMESVEVMKCILSLRKHRLIQEIGNHYYIRSVI